MVCDEYLDDGACRVEIDMERIAFEQLCGETGLDPARLIDENLTRDAQASAADALVSA